MINCIVLSVALLFLLVVNFLYFKKNIVEPAVIFNASFFVSSVALVFASAKWQKDISLATVLIVTASVAFFSAVCYFIKRLFLSKNKEKIAKKEKEDQARPIEINKIILLLFLLFSIVVIVLTLYFTVKAVGGDFKHIGSALYKFRNYTLRYKYDLNFPAIVEVLSGVVHASSYYFIYVFINNIISKKKIDVLLLCLVITTSLSTVLDGTRGAIINIALSVIPFSFLLFYQNRKKILKISKKMTIIILSIFFAFLCIFQQTAVILGRNDAKEFSTADYIYIYLGAPIYNLSTFLDEGIKEEKYVGIHTFSSIYDEFGDYVPENEQSFRRVNDKNIGNVYTILFDFICDGKLVGLVIGLLIMAGLSQALYEYIVRKIKNNKIGAKPSMALLIYGYMFGGLVFAFFGNKFFPQLFNPGFLKYVILWCGYNYCLRFVEKKRLENVS